MIAYMRHTYPYNIPSILNLDELVFRKSVTFIAGENGSGKSTLIEALAINAGFNPEGEAVTLISGHNTLIPDCIMT
ncbi:MAG: AAA family ATPase [Bacteroides sp.]|nr:AAA family ATPase [Bacteroides sp.]